MLDTTALRTPPTRSGSNQWQEWSKGARPILRYDLPASLVVFLVALPLSLGIAVASGILQILFGVSRVARAALAISPVVVHAMLAGIGVTIALQQVHVLLGGD